MPCRASNIVGFVRWCQEPFPERQPSETLSVVGEKSPSHLLTLQLSIGARGVDGQKANHRVPYTSRGFSRKKAIR
jgi:hypothetical protein